MLVVLVFFCAFQDHGLVPEIFGAPKNEATKKMMNSTHSHGLSHSGLKFRSQRKSANEDVFKPKVRRNASILSYLPVP